ncbi:alpha/beta fold hydrolase [Streptomyces sp. WMMC1477]|uniref:alpha/beta fold hydrolase n=1 Tax=Streptomyces sp. WMMC1477 TaxID=3015155 RepID=UPI0022B73F9E|nr:alpha/beta hydrolase [Streptomyces sp. WMMC1477]MCZ7431300.1 alpha/beta hydrolase [Streptomyces sp. WMMC1477]
MPEQLVHTLRHQGYTYGCRVVPHPRPRLAPVLLVGGAFQDMYSWRRHETLLGRAATVITVDLPGWGGADALSPSIGTDLLADAAHRVIEHTGAGPCHVVGASFGALIGQRLAQRHPAAVASLALSGVAGSLTPEQADDLEELERLLTAGALAAFAERMVDSLSPRVPERAVRRGEPVRRLLSVDFLRASDDARAKMIDNLRRLRLARMVYPDPVPDVPAVMFTGEHDRATPSVHGRRLAATYPRGRSVVITEADHCVHLQRDAEYCRLLLTHFGGGDVRELPFCRTPHPAGATVPARPSGALA